MSLPSDPYNRIKTLIERLLAPDGCPWDREQSHQTLRQYVIEEAYEVVDAIDSGSMDHLKEELGDLLFQVFFHSAFASEAGHFSIDDVIEAVCEKMVRRHPHVFGDETLDTAQAVLDQWSEIKKQEKGHAPHSALDSTPRALPALSKAYKFQKKAAKIGFDWPSAEGVFAKLDEEIAEIREAIAAPHLMQDAIEQEVGDLLFTVVNLARKLGVEPEVALNRTNGKFARRFRHVETQTANTPSGSYSPEQLEHFWEEAKQTEM